MNTAANEPAFPACNEANNNRTMGMTLLEHYAGLAMQGMLAGIFAGEASSPESAASMPERTAVNARVFAQALIAELEKVAP
jgi:hypothetical protein